MKRGGRPSGSRAQRPSRQPSRPPARGGGGRRPPEGGGRPPERDRARWVVGLHSCEETLKVRPRQIREIWLREDWKSSQQLSALEEIARSARVPMREKSAGQLDAVGSGNQGVALACLESPQVDWDKLASQETALVLVLDGIEDPHNLGSILRTAWLTGTDAIFTPTDRAVGLTPAACKVASGGAEHVPVEADANLPSVLERLKEIGFWIYGLAEGGTRKPWEFQLGKKVAWVIGSESGGIRKPTERACDELVRIPQVATGSSYNAAIACGMALAETCRQSGKPE